MGMLHSDDDRAFHFGFLPGFRVDQVDGHQKRGGHQVDQRGAYRGAGQHPHLGIGDAAGDADWNDDEGRAQHPAQDRNAAHDPVDAIERRHQRLQIETSVADAELAAHGEAERRTVQHPVIQAHAAGLERTGSGDLLVLEAACQHVRRLGARACRHFVHGESAAQCGQAVDPPGTRRNAKAAARRAQELCGRGARGKFHIQVVGPGSGEVVTPQARHRIRQRLVACRAPRADGHVARSQGGGERNRDAAQLQYPARPRSRDSERSARRRSLA